MRATVNNETTKHFLFIFAKSFVTTNNTCMPEEVAWERRIYAGIMVHMEAVDMVHDQIVDMVTAI